MKILQVHKYFTAKKGGGSVSAFFETKKILERKGHEIIIFSMQDAENEESVYSKYFPSHFDINKSQTVFQKLKLAVKSIHNREATKKLEQLIIKEKPEIAHIHNIYHYITPAIFTTLKKYNIPIVFKLSDYKPICPNYKLFTQGSICERCKGAKYYNAVRYKCLKNSYSVSGVAMLEAYYHKMKKSYKKVDYFLAPSNFMIKKVTEFGVPIDKVCLLRNVLNFSDFKPEPNKHNFFSYVGRISEEKGLNILIEAVAYLKKNNQLGNFHLIIVGKGPAEETLKAMVDDLNLTSEVEFRGFLKKMSSKWKYILKKSSFTVLPSIWYDNSPIAVSESLAFGTPVIISDLGGTPEMIDDKISGLIFKHNNVKDLAKKIKYFIDNNCREKFFKAAIQKVEQLNDEDNYYNQLLGYYYKAIKKNKQ